MLRKVMLPPAAGYGGALHLHSMPGRFEPLGEFLAAAESAGVKHAVCLVDDTEIATKSPEYLSAIRTGSLPFTLHRVPIPDYKLPENPEALRSVLLEVLGVISRGDSVVIHCAAGIGRTGMVATLLLTAMGLDAEEAAARVRAAGSSPNTPGQKDFTRLRDAGMRRIRLRPGVIPLSNPRRAGISRGSRERNQFHRQDAKFAK